MKRVNNSTSSSVVGTSTGSFSKKSITSAAANGSKFKQNELDETSQASLQSQEGSHIEEVIYGS